jgi:MFS family permease
MVGNSVMLLLIALLRERGMGPRTIGLTNSVVLAGGIGGALLCGRIIKAFGSRHVFLAGGWVYVAALGLAAVAPATWAIAGAVCVFVFASVPTASVWEAYTVSLVPDRLTGRIGSISSFAAQSLTWAGFLLAGWLVDAFGAPAAMLSFAALLIPFAIANHLARALTLLNTRPEHVQEIA